MSTTSKSPAVSMYVCAPHYAPVNWRGKGCPRCTAYLARRRKRRTHEPLEPLFEATQMKEIQ